MTLVPPPQELNERDADTSAPPPLQGRLRLTPLGGLAEFGKNSMLLEWGQDMILIDCGQKFPDGELLGVDTVIPDFDYLLRARDRLRGIVLTHGHEDHIGALPYLLRQLGGSGLPVWGSRLTLELLRSKFDEHGGHEQSELQRAEPGMRARLGEFEVEFLSVEHSIPMAYSLAIHLPIGTVLHSGDYKLSLEDDPPEPGTLAEFVQRRREGPPLALLISDSTNVDRPGIAPREPEVEAALEPVLADASGTVIVASFSSNLRRAQTVLDLAARLGRKVAICGFSIERNFDIATSLGILRYDEDSVMPLHELVRLSPAQRLILTTGTQGEPMSALSRLSMNSFRGYRIEPGDLVVMSSRIIPGNEKSIFKMINHFYRHGARVVTEREARVHASGHAYRDEMKGLISELRPQYLLPVHGEVRQLIAHGELGIEMGMSEDQILVLDNGMQVEMVPERKGSERLKARVEPTDWSGEVMVDGQKINSLHEVVLRDRKHLSEDGMLTVIVVIDQRSHKIIAGPDIVSRGFVLMEESESLIDACKELVIETFEQTGREEQEEWEVVKVAVRRALRRFLASATDRYPVILPVVVEI